MDRRAFLAAGAASLSVVAGCLGGGGGGGGNSDYPKPEDGNTDGYAPEFDEQPKQRDVNTDSFETVQRDGQTVPLAPADVAYYWYKRGEARFADARGKTQYEKSHVYGAVLSPSNGNFSDVDPTKEWPKDDRIVCYCGCPHHLSSIRAAKLIANGYSNVYVIDEGFWKGWHERGHPVRGSNVNAEPKAWVIEGQTDAASADREAWAFHHPTGQREATGITDDGSYELHLRFHEVGPDSTVQVETPDYSVEGKLEDLATGTVQG